LGKKAVLNDKWDSEHKLKEQIRSVMGGIGYRPSQGENVGRIIEMAR
jgi:hypothetical protein